MNKLVRGAARLCGVKPAVVLAWLSLAQFGIVLGTVVLSLGYLSGEVHQRSGAALSVATLSAPAYPANKD
jgi:hypothetical protein